jgi:hypothetical protein
VAADSTARAAKYRARALECLDRAEKVHEPVAKSVFKQAAVFWLELANQADEFEIKV